MSLFAQQPQSPLTGGGAGAQAGVSVARGAVASVAVGSFGASGRPDLVYVNGASTGSGGTAGVSAGLLRNGAAGFVDAPENRLRWPGALGAVAAVGDLDGDERPDLAVAVSPGSLEAADLCIYYGTGAATGTALTATGAAFTAKAERGGCITLPNPGGALPRFSEIAVAPLRTGEGAGVFVVDAANRTVDVVGNSAAAAGGLAGWYVASRVTIPGSGALGAMVPADVNGDGATDILLGDAETGSVMLFAGNGDGSFQEGVRLALGTPVSSFLVSDVDGDGRPDLVVESAEGTIEVHRGTGMTGAPFESARSGGVSTGLAGSRLGTIADLNRDGVPELVIATSTGVRVLPGQPGSRWSAASSYATGAEPGSFVVADFDGDGNADLGLVSAEGVEILYGRGDGTLAPARLLVTAAPASPAAAVVPMPQASGSDQTTSSAVSSLPRVHSDTAQGIATETALDLCVGPTADCPSNGLVNPAFSAALSMDWGQTFNGTVVATATDASALDPASTVLFEDSFDGAAPVTLCTLTIAADSTCPPEIGVTVGTAVGTHVFTAYYSGDSTHAPSSSAAVTVTVSPDTTTGVVVSSGTPSLAGQAVTFTATFTGSYAAPDGTVTFLDGATAMGTAALVPSTTAVTSAPTPSTAAFTAASLSAGTHTITASYGGSTDFVGASATVQQVVVGTVATLSQLGASPSPSYAGQAVTFTDQVTAAGVVPSGTVTFAAGGRNLATVGLSGGVATFSTAGLPVGTNVVTATYSGAAGVNGSVATYTQTVLAVPASTSRLVASANPSYAGQSVTFTDTVTGGGAAYSGTVTFSAGGSMLGTVVVSATGVATWTTTALLPGSDTVTATYSGSATLGGSSASAVQTVNALPAPGSTNFSITVTPEPVSVGVGATAAVRVTVAPLSGYTAPVTLACAGLPYEAACSFGEVTIPAGGGSTTLLVSAMAPHSCGSDTPYFAAGVSGLPGTPGRSPGVPLAAAAGLAAFVLPGRRRWVRVLVALLAVGTVLGMAGCGSCTDLGTRPGTYSIRVSGTAGSNAEVESATVPVVVHL